MTRQGLHYGFRHAAAIMTTQVMALIAMALCTLLAYQPHELSRASKMDLSAIVGSVITTVSHSVMTATHMHEYAAMLILPVAFVGCLSLGGLYIWSQKDS